MGRVLRSFKGLSHKQRSAVEHYFDPDVAFNKTEALRRAGYAFPEAWQARFFKHPSVAAEIEKRMSKVQKKHELTRDWLIEQYIKIATAGEVLSKFKMIGHDGSLFWDFTEATPEELALIDGLATEIYTEGRGPNAETVKKFKIEITKPKEALDSLARVGGFFTDTVKHTGEVSLVERLQKGRARVKKDEKGS